MQELARLAQAELQQPTEPLRADAVEQAGRASPGRLGRVRRSALAGRADRRRRLVVDLVVGLVGRRLVRLRSAVR